MEILTKNTVGVTFCDTMKPGRSQKLIILESPKQCFLYDLCVTILVWQRKGPVKALLEDLPTVHFGKPGITCSNSVTVSLFSLIMIKILIMTIVILM